MVTLTRQQSRAVDQIAIERFGFSGLVLMENAGRGVVDVLLEIDPGLPEAADQSVAILCGKGNNAGDGFVIARHLEIRGVRCKVVLLVPSAELAGDAKSNFELLASTDVPVIDLSGSADLASTLADEVGHTRWILDAMLGTGAVGEPREPVASAIGWMNVQPGRRLAIDAPSGLDCDTGEPATNTVRADQTCTFVAAKQGFIAPSAAEFLGQLHIVSIGTPTRLIEEVLAAE